LIKIHVKIREKRSIYEGVNLNGSSGIPDEPFRLRHFHFEFLDDIALFFGSRIERRPCFKFASASPSSISSGKIIERENEPQKSFDKVMSRDEDRYGKKETRL